MTSRVSFIACLCLCMVVSLLGGCGTIVHGSSQVVAITSDPPGATVRLDNGTVLTTPSSVKLERKKDYILTLSKDGYQTQTIPLNSVLSGWLAGNIIFGGIIGGGVDMISGAAWTITPENISVSLTPLRPGESAASAVPAQMSTRQKLESLESLKAQGVVTDKEYTATKARLNEDLKKEIQATSTSASAGSGASGSAQGATGTPVGQP